MKNEVVELCERFGFGSVMQVAADEWAKRDPSGALTVGPCTVFLERCPCANPAECDWCCGSGRVTRKVAEVIRSER